MPDSSTVIVDIAAVDSVDDHAVRALLGAALRLAEEQRLMMVNGARPEIRATLRAAGLHKWAALT
jgi:anti-anti-sigma regulatory factor